MHLRLPWRSTLHFTEGYGLTGTDSPAFGVRKSMLFRMTGFILEFYYAHREDDSRAIAEAVLSNTEFWEEDLTTYDGLVEAVADDLQVIEEQGAYELMRRYS